MPIYEYFCEKCCLKFERVLNISLSSSNQGCPECKTSSGRFPSAVTPTFISSGAESNTGLSSLDNNFDRLVGVDSVNKWKAIADREKLKLEILKSNPEAAPRDLKQTGDSYTVMSKQESESFKEKFFRLKVDNKKE